MTIRVGVFGAAGRMGRTVCEAVCADPELQLVAAVDPHHAGLALREVTGLDVDDLAIMPTPEGMADAGVEVAVDFTEADAARENLRWCAANGVHAVVGTSGLTDADVEDLGGRFVRSSCVIAPNFAIGAVMMIRMAEIAAPYFDAVEVIELHHGEKVDAPSGTAMHTVERIAAASSTWDPDPTRSHVLDGARGGRGPADIPVHSIRMRGLVASQEVLFGTTGQTLSIRHDTTDRTSFMPGVLLAVRRVADRPGVTVGLDVLLGL